MKKTFLALLISSCVALTACNEKENGALNEKLQQSEQVLTQLKSELAKKEQELTALQSEVAKKNGSFPSLNVVIETFFNKSETIKFNQKPQDDQAILSATLSYFVSLPNTGIDWLDNLLARKMLISYAVSREENPKQFDPNKVTGNEKAELKKLLEENYAESLAELKEGATLALEKAGETLYIGQRGNIVTFIQPHYTYSGGAHGMYATDYVNVDVVKKRIIQLDDLVPKAKQKDLKEWLWMAYEDRTPLDENGHREFFTKKEDFTVSDNFIFTEDGLKFVYPPYVLGSFAEGEIGLTVPWYSVNELLAPEYQRTKKDGYNLAPERATE